MMDIQQLEFFIAIYEFGNYTSASEALYVSQSSMSKQILSLEKELGVTLFNRTKRKTTLTSDGHEILKYAKRIVSDYRSINDICKLSRTSNVEKIRIGIIPVMNQYGVTDAIFDFEKLHPEYTVDIDETNTADLLTKLDQKYIMPGVFGLSNPTRFGPFFPTLNGPSRPTPTGGNGSYRYHMQHFGGYKLSGIGREGILDIEEMTQKKTIIIRGFINNQLFLFLHKDIILQNAGLIPKAGANRLCASYNNFKNNPLGGLKCENTCIILSSEYKT